MPINALIACARCGRAKSPEEFSSSKDSLNGLHSYCKECMSDYMSARRPKVQHAPRKCAHERCSNVFTPAVSTKKYCSNSCRTTALKMKKVALAKVGKQCETCGVDISHKYASAKWCGTECRNRSITPEQRRAWALSQNYGITPEDYDQMVKSQGGLCAICACDDPGTPHGFWHVDHCHGSGKVRSLLCQRCNMGLGAFYDIVEHLDRAAEYIERHRQVAG